MAPIIPRNTPAANTPYFTPAQSPPAGTALNPQSNGAAPPTLFTPVKLRGITVQNRIFLAPLCQYSSDSHVTARMTPWHMAHLGGIISRGPGLSVIEATAVVPEGRITPEDLGLWSDDQIAPMRELNTFAHSQGQLTAIQLAHAGRKASMVAPFVSFTQVATEDVGGWPTNVVAPSELAYSPDYAAPRALSVAEIGGVVAAFAAAAKRAVAAGFDAIEIHSAHGYLLHSFLSPVSNIRTDHYGGSFENRVRIVLEIVAAVRDVIPESMPLIVRISADDWLADRDSWTIEQSCRLAPLLARAGVDLIDVSSAALHPDQKIIGGPGYQAHFAKAVKQALKAAGETCLVSAVGSITSGTQAQKLLDEGYADIISVGRGFQKNPGLVWAWADDLEVDVVMAKQMGWGFGGRAGGKLGKRAAEAPLGEAVKE